ncbi:MAG: PIG-L family deacetylase, partial [Chloroflexi bacterium]|nr:PIG-L family deacetylase [Chloroflexota bacterium]
SLSCGGTIHQQTQAGQAALVVTICAAPPQSDDPFSPFAEAMHRSWGNPGDVVATRQAEDRASTEILGADFLRLNFHDCIYRGHAQYGQWFYNNDTELFGSIHPDDRPLINKVAVALLELIPVEAETIIYAPLGVGHHVDHQIVHAAAWQLRQKGWQIAFYEDYPYADAHARYGGFGEGYTLEATLAAQRAANLQPQVRFFSEENLQAKMNSVRAYASQLRMLFGSETDMEQRLRNYALWVGEGRLAERVWIPG